VTSVPADDGFRKYLAAGNVLTTVTRARAEEIVRELMNTGDSQRSQAQQRLDDIIERSRAATEELVDRVRREVSTQLAARGIEPEDVARQVSDFLKQTAHTGRTAASDTATRVSDTATAAKRTAATAADKGRAAAKRGARNKKAAASGTAPRSTASDTAKGDPGRGPTGGGAPPRVTGD